MAENELGTIEHDIAQTRERLASTIDQLVHRASPKTIAKREVAQVKAFFVDENGPRTDNIVKVAAGVGGVVLLFVAVRRLAR